MGWMHIGYRARQQDAVGQFHQGLKFTIRAQSGDRQRNRFRRLGYSRNILMTNGMKRLTVDLSAVRGHQYNRLTAMSHLSNTFFT